MDLLVLGNLLAFVDFDPTADLRHQVPLYVLMNQSEVELLQNPLVHLGLGLLNDQPHGLVRVCDVLRDHETVESPVEVWVLHQLLLLRVPFQHYLRFE